MAPVQFDCGVCFDHKTEENPMVIDESTVCRDCIQEQILPLFHAALEYETEYPVRWGPVELKATDFTLFLGKGFVRRWQTREREYLSTNRIYCKHTVFASQHEKIANRANLWKRGWLKADEIQVATEAGIELVSCGSFVSARSHRSTTNIMCHHCNGRICARCEEPIFLQHEDRQHHDCVPVDKSAPEGIMEGQIRGRDYQICPNCVSIVMLADGCNTIRCMCRIEFCFICGEPAKHNSLHWMAGKPCPRWNQPGAANAHHDPEGGVEHHEEGVAEPDGVEHPEGRVGLEVIMFHMMERADEEVAHGGVIDAAWYEAFMNNGGVGEIAHDADFLAWIDGGGLWAALQHMGRHVERLNILFVVIDEIIAWGEERGFTPEDEIVSRMCETARSLQTDFRAIRALRS